MGGYSTRPKALDGANRKRKAESKSSRQRRAKRNFELRTLTPGQRALHDLEESIAAGVGYLIQNGHTWSEVQHYNLRQMEGFVALARSMESAEKAENASIMRSAFGAEAKDFTKMIRELEEE